MFNVLPENLKKAISKEYYIRLSIIIILFIGGLQIASLFFLFPSWVLSVSREKDVSSELQAITESQKPIRGETASTTVTSTNGLLAITNNVLANPPVLSFVDTIVSLKKPSIHINEFSYSSVDGSDTRVSIGGISNTRESLVSFVKDLKSTGLFVSVDLPVSNLAKDTNIEFSLNLTISKK